MHVRVFACVIDSCTVAPCSLSARLDARGCGAGSISVRYWHMNQEDEHDVGNTSP
jgi:hypothetical protein